MKYRFSLKHLSLLCVCLLFLMACKDDVSKIYSTKYPVRFFYEVAASPELYNAMGNPGQFVSIRPINGKLRISGYKGSTDYSLSLIGSREFEYGLGGLIVGTSTNINDKNVYINVAYDLACPSCDRQSYRLTLKDNGTALCSHCGNSFDLNNYGWIIGVNDDTREVRGLYRYDIAYDGVGITVANKLKR